MPRCVFGEGHYRCGKRGHGQPPLCREHYDLVSDADADDEDGEDFWERLLDSLFEHPYVNSKIEEIIDLIKHPPAQARTCQPPPVEPPRRQSRARKPAPEPPKPPGPTLVEAREILHFSPNQTLSEKDIRKRQRQLARLAHPDVGGSVEAMRRINEAATALISQLR